MKRKIALFLALVMIISLLPANLFAAPGVSVPLNDSTEGRTEAHGSEIFTVTIPMTALRGRSFDEWVPGAVGGQGIPLYVSLTGTGDGNLRFPVNNQWARRWDDPNIPAYTGQTWPLGVDASDVRNVFASRITDTNFDPGRRMTGQFYRVGHQSGWVVLDMELLIDDHDFIDGTAATNLDDLREEIRVAEANLAFARSFQAGVRAIENAYNAFVAAVDALNTWIIANGPLPPSTPALQDAFDALLATAVTRALALQNLPVLNVPATTVVNIPGVTPNAPINTNITGALNAINSAIDTFFTDLEAVDADLDPDVLADPANALAVFNAFGDLQTALGTDMAGFGVLLAPAGTVGSLLTDLQDANDDLAQEVGDNPILGTWPLIPGGASGFLDIEIPVYRVRHADARLEIRLGHPGGQILAQGPLANFTDRGISVEYGNVVVFEHTAVLNSLTIRENAPGALTRNVPGTNPSNRSVAIRLTAPHGYSWERAVGRPGHTWYANNTVRQMDRGQWILDTASNPVYVWNADNSGFAYNNPNWPGSPFITSPMNLLQFHCTVDGIYTLPDGREEMLIIIDNLYRNPDMPLIPASLVLDNLRLIAGPNAPAVQEEVNIDVRVGHLCAWGYIGFDYTYPNPIQPALVSLQPGAQPTAPPTTPPPAGQATPRPRPTPPSGTTTPGGYEPANPPCFFFTNPARFPQNLNQVTRAAADRPAGDTGLALDWQNIGYRLGVTVARRAEAGLSLAVGGDEVTLRSGSITTAASTGWAGNSATLVRTGRTQRLHVQETVSNALALSPSHPVTFTFPEGVQVVGVRYRVDPNGFGWVNRNRTEPFANHTRFIDDQTVTIATTLDRHSSIRRLEIYFDISVEAGFVQKYGTDEIVVTVSGSGVANLPENDRTMTVATVVDPVTVSFPEAISVPALGLEHNLLALTPIGDIVITETEAGMLRHNTAIEVFIMRSFIQRPFDITLVPGALVVDTASGLTLSARQTLNVTRDGHQIVGITFTVVNESRTTTDGGTITLSANDIFGHVYPGEEYWLVVSGNAVAANHSLVHGESQVNNQPIRGIFTSLPYYGELIDSVIGFEDGDRAHSLDGVRFDPAVAIGGITPPIIWERLPGMAHEAGFVAARSFATVAGVTEDNINWASGVATITGFNYQGQRLTVILTQGSTNATIVVDGAVGTVDIADFAEGQSGPSQTVTPIFRNNRIYLPFRFLFNAFGYSDDYVLTREGNVAVVRAR
ncbi:MAG: copper amine oxidase N-terminal domain-containing protein [Defluviitaleaceae bacterium]|nr:copper amine oxidase N-terminal domain-containing protein [Defluviitaleaceae bacterium]